MQQGNHDLREHEKAGTQVIEAAEGGPVWQSIGYMLHWLGGAPGVQGTDYSSVYHKSHLLNNYSYWGPDGVLAPERRAT